VLTMYDDDEHLFAALEAQASAFVAKSAPTDEVLSAAKHARPPPTPSRRPTCPAPCAGGWTPPSRGCRPASRRSSTCWAGPDDPGARQALYISESTARPTPRSSTRSSGRTTAARRSSRRCGSGC
jgi:hypothetical protein